LCFSNFLLSVRSSAQKSFHFELFCARWEGWIEGGSDGNPGQPSLVDLAAALHSSTYNLLWLLKLVSFFALSLSLSLQFSRKSMFWSTFSHAAAAAAINNSDIYWRQPFLLLFGRFVV
jgi:hypothetical protein